MSRSIRSEFSAHQSLTQTASRADWRAILASRDAKRTEYRYRQARRPEPAKFWLAPTMLVLFAVSFPVVSFFS